jgi:hypothetical protein
VKSIGLNEDAKYSRIVKITIGGSAITGMTAYPNSLTGNTITLQLNNLAAGDYTITLYNAEGRQVYNTVVNHSGGNATQTITLRQQVSAEMYYLELNGKNGEKYLQTPSV